MNATPIQPGSSDRDELARLLPEPAERELPSGRHLATSQIRETNFFVTPDGAEYRAPGGATFVTEWTDQLPK